MIETELVLKDMWISEPMDSEIRICWRVLLIGNSKSLLLIEVKGW
jgi:hypothetical protein